MLAQNVQSETKMFCLYLYLFICQSMSVTFLLAQGCQLFLEFPKLRGSFSPTFLAPSGLGLECMKLTAMAQKHLRHENCW